MKYGVAVLIVLLAGADAVFLRRNATASPANATVSAVVANSSAAVVANATQKDGKQANVDAAMDLIKSLSGSLSSKSDDSDEDSSSSAEDEKDEAPAADAAPAAETAPAAEAAPPKPKEHAKLDFGFTAFEANLTAAVSDSIRSVTAGAFWSGGLQQKLIDNVTASMTAEIKTALTPLKQTISKTWMALPKDEQRDVFVNQLKSSFQPVFVDNLDSLITHMKLGLRRVKGYGDETSKLTKDDALQKSEQTLYETILAEHCYEDARPHNGTQAAKKFCVPSSVAKFASRLKDTEGLIGMSMRFEAGAMGLVQTSKK